MEEKKKKQYVSDNAQLMAEWHPTKNNTLSPTQVASKSGKKFGGNVIMGMSGKHKYITAQQNN